MVKRLLLLALLIGLAPSACDKATPSGHASGGIEGTVVLGPLCPVEQEGSPCPDRPVEALVIARDASGHTLGPVRTNADGRFTFPLEPGTYEVTAREVTDNPRLAKPLSVTVSAGPFLSVTIQIDSGIR